MTNIEIKDENVILYTSYSTYNAQIEKQSSCQCAKTSWENSIDLLIYKVSWTIYNWYHEISHIYYNTPKYDGLSLGDRCVIECKVESVRDCRIKTGRH